jgi:diguanylate cyclase (GGDEF)-like protein
VMILAVGAMLGGAVDLLLFVDTPSLARRWLCILLLVLGHALIAYLVLREPLRRWQWARVVVVLLTAAFCLMDAYGFLMHPRKDLGDWLSLEIYVCAAIAYAIYANEPGRRLIGALGVVGYLTWGAYCITHFALGEDSAIVQALYTVWTVPKYLVAFSMILMAFDEANREKNNLMATTQRLYEDFRLLYETHPHPTWIYDAVTGRILSANQAAVTIYGFSEEDLQSMHAADLEAPHDVDEFSVEQLLTPPAEGERLRHRYKDGSVIWVNFVDHSIDFQGRQARLLMARDITASMKINMELAHRAHHDVLTGLPNRALLEGRIQHTLDACRRDGRKAALLTMDIDNFKHINDEYGHLVGDACLQTVANRLQSKIRQVDTIARNGGDEFVAVIGGLHAVDGARTVAASLLQLFEEPLDLPGLSLLIGISIGVAIYPDDADEIEALRRCSDEALYAAKRNGRNGAVLASEMAPERV